MQSKGSDSNPRQTCGLRKQWALRRLNAQTWELLDAEDMDDSSGETAENPDVRGPDGTSSMSTIGPHPGGAATSQSEPKKVKTNRWGPYETKQSERMALIKRRIKEKTRLWLEKRAMDRLNQEDWEKRCRVLKKQLSDDKKKQEGARGLPSSTEADLPEITSYRANRSLKIQPVQVHCCGYCVGIPTH